MCGRKRRGKIRKIKCREDVNAYFLIVVCCHCESDHVRSLPCRSSLSVQCCPPPMLKWDNYYPQPKRPCNIPVGPCSTRINKPINVCYTPVSTCCKREYPQVTVHRTCKTPCRTPSGMDIYEEKDNESDDIDNTEIYGSEVDASKSAAANYKVNFNDYVPKKFNAPCDRDSQAYYPNNYKQ